MTHEEYKQQLTAWAGLTEKRLAALCDEYLPQQSELGQAARYSLLGGGKRVRAVLTLAACQLVRYTVPASIHPHRMQDKQIVRFRVGNVYKNCEVCVYFDDTCIMRLKKKVMAPGEMEQVILQKKKLQEYEDLSKITIRIEQGEA